MSQAEADLIASAYVALLRLPHGKARLNLQTTLCVLRDELATFEARDADHIQTKFELVAELFKLNRLGVEFEKVLFDNLWELYAR